MEILVLLLIAGLAGVWWINRIMKKNEEKLKEQSSLDSAVLYKVESLPEVVKEIEVPSVQPEPTKCGCGRSPTGYCVGLHKLTADEWSVHADNPTKVELAKEVKRTRKPKSKPVTVDTVVESKKSRGRKPSVAKKEITSVKSRPSKKTKSVN
jgi:cytoskeletal protein RodZ